MSKNWGEVSEGAFTNYKSNAKKSSDFDDFFDKVDSTGGELSSMSGSLQVMLANAQRANAAPAAAAPSVGIGLGGPASSNSEDES